MRKTVVTLTLLLNEEVNTLENKALATILQYHNQKQRKWLYEAKKLCMSSRG